MLVFRGFRGRKASFVDNKDTEVAFQKSIQTYKVKTRDVDKETSRVVFIIESRDGGR